MRNAILVTLVLWTALAGALMGQPGSTAGSGINQPSAIMTTPPWDGKPIDPQCRKVNGCLEHRSTIEVTDGIESRCTKDASGVGDAEPILAGRSLVAHSLALHRNFTANNLNQFTPGDNAMGISSGGYIVSADNYTIDFFGDGPDTLLQFQLHHVFYGDSALKGIPFDPRVIYDRYANRFIVVMCAYVDSATNYVLISFSKDEDPQNGWYQYRLRSDTLDDNQWFDFATITVNKEELFISGNMYTDGAHAFAGNKIFQIAKAEGFAGLPLRHRVWADVRDSDGDLGYTIVPLQDGLMRDSYSRGVYLASTKPLSAGQSADRLLWYRITDSLGAANVAIDTHATSSIISYEPASPYFQLGGGAIKPGDCKVHGGFVMDSILNFVYCRGFNNYSVVVLNRLDVRSNSLQRYPWGNTVGLEDYVYPSLAFAGSDSSDADNMILCFGRTSSNIYPQLNAVHFDDGAFFGNSTVIRQGDGFIDFYPGNQQERWGDYTTAQRRYDAFPPRVWLVGGHTNGPNPNRFGITNFLNAFIAEVGDSLLLGVPELSNSNQGFGVEVLPNPNSGEFSIGVSNDLGFLRKVDLLDLGGRTVAVSTSLDRKTVHFGLSHLPSGIYFARLHVNARAVRYAKVIVNHGG